MLRHRPLLNSSRFAFSTTAYNTAFTDPYLVLEVSRDSSFQEVKWKYYWLAKMLHPDRNPNDPNALSRFLLIKNAFTDLELKLSPSAAKARHRNMRSYETTEEKLKRKYQSKRKEAKQTGEGFNFQEA